MKKLLLCVISLFFLIRCTTLKGTQKQISNGNYDAAINNSIEKLSSGKRTKKSDSYILLLEDAFKKATEKNLRTVSFYEKDNNPVNFEQIYNTYLKLRQRQEAITPLLPLYKTSANKNAVFQFKNYDSEIINYKNKLSEYIYNNALGNLDKTIHKHGYRSIHENLMYLNKINPNYKDVNNLLDEARFKGTNFVTVEVENRSRTILPRRLHNELVDIDTYGLNDFWTVYHNTKNPRNQYDYEIVLDVISINVSPEKTNERHHKYEKLVVDGWDYLKNEKNEIVKDEKGEKIKVEAFKKVNCEYYEYTQFKSVKLHSRVRVLNTKTRKLVDRFPLDSEFVFDHIYANYRGDKRALDEAVYNYINLEPLRFPTSEQMVYDAGQDLKNQLKNILVKLKL